MDDFGDLLAVASDELMPPVAEFASEYLAPWGPRGVELSQLLQGRNGFYAFESALHVLPVTVSRPKSDDLVGWNSTSLWRDEYGDLVADLLFFAEDVFGGQFALDRNGRILAFDPETAETEPLALTMEEWVGKLLADYSYLTGYPLAHEWQVRHGQLPAGHRLLPKVPFFAGGTYELENLHLLDAVKGMQLRGSIARQVADLPDGAQIRFKIE